MTRTRYVALASRSGNPLRRKVLYRRGQWVVHWSVNSPGFYAISHAPTGYSVPFAFITLTSAKAAIRPIADWDWNYTDPNQPPAATKRKALAWYRAMREHPPDGVRCL